MRIGGFEKNVVLGPGPRFISDCHGGSPVCSSMIGDLGLEKFGISVSAV